MDSQKLVDLGLTKREANAYLTLLGLEQATAGEIAKHSREDRTNIYDSLSGLVKKGLVNYIKKHGCMHYRIAPPQMLRNYLEEKEKILSKILPELNKIYKSYKPKSIIEVYENKEGIKTVLRDILNEEKNFVGFGATDRAHVLFPEFTKMYLRERKKKNIRARQVYAKGGKVLKSKISVFRSISPEFIGPATTLIYGEKVALFLWFTEPVLVVLIKSNEAAQAYKRQFEFMWKVAK